MGFIFRCNQVRICGFHPWSTECFTNIKCQIYRIPFNTKDHSNSLTSYALTFHFLYLKLSSWKLRSSIRLIKVWYSFKLWISKAFCSCRCTTGHKDFEFPSFGLFSNSGAIRSAQFKTGGDPHDHVTHESYAIVKRTFQIPLFQFPPRLYNPSSDYQV